MLDSKVLYSLGERTKYKRFSAFIKAERLSQDYREIYLELSSYYKDNPNLTAIDWDDFKSHLLLIKRPNLSPGKTAAIEAAIDLIKNTKLSADDPPFLESLNTRHYSSLISELSADVVDGLCPVSDLLDLFQEMRLNIRDLRQDEDSLTTTDDQVLTQVSSLKEGIRYSWPLEELNLMLGPIGKGDFLLLGSRPDGGKTTFLAQAACHFATQLKEGECVLWCNNEEPRERVAARRIQAALHWTRSELDADPKKAIEAYQNRLGKNKIISLDKSGMTVHDIESVLEAYHPKVIIIDQLWKLGGFENEKTGVDRYAKLAQYVRDLAKMYGPIIGASQLDATAENKKYADMGSLYNSKTSVQGEADAIILIGQTKEEPNVRFIRAPKNKLPYANDDYRSQGAAINLDKATAQFYSQRDGRNKYAL